MQVGERKLQDLLHAGNQFVIPVFQRDYVWKEQDWERLWDDVTALRGAGASAEHFMGSIVSVPMDIQPGEIPRYLIIDGQQRLITFMMLLAAIRDEAARFSVETLPEQIQQNYLTHGFQKGLAKYKVLPRLRDRGDFFSLVEGKGRPNTKSRVVAAYDYFAGRLLEDDGDKGASLRDVFTSVTAKLSLVTITLKPDQNAFAIFATLNATGQKLEEADLIRNYVFMDVSLDEQDEFDNQHWLPFETSFEASGGQPAVSPTAFYRDFLMRNGEYVTRDGVYVAFQRDGEVKTLTRTELVGLLRKYAELYLWILRPSTAPTAALQLELRRVKRVEQSTSYPLILSLLYRYKYEDLSEEELLDCLRAIVSFVLRRAITNWSTRAYNRLFPGAIADLGEGKVLAKLTCYLARKGWPDDASFVEALLTYPVYRRWPNLTRLMLVAVEDAASHKETVDVEGLLDGGVLQIEHVMPQSIGNDKAGKWWQEHLGGAWEDMQRDWLHSIGNLTLTGYNLKLSNREFEWKRQEFAKSNLHLNHWFSQTESWGVEDITVRGRAIAEDIAQRWPSAVHFEPDAAGVKLDPGEVPARPARTMAPIRREFWEYIELACAEAGVPISLTPSVDTWMTANVGLSRGYVYVVSRTSKGTVAVQYNSNWHQTESLFGWLRGDQQQIQAHFQDRISWVNTPGSPQQFLEVAHFADLADRSAWDQYRDWFISSLQSLQAALGPLVGRVVSRDALGIEPGMDAFVADLKAFNPEVKPTVLRLMEWAGREMSEPYWSMNRGRVSWIPQVKKAGRWHHLVRVTSDASIEFRFLQAGKKSPLNEPAALETLLGRVNAIPLVNLPSEALRTSVQLPIAMFSSEEAFDGLLGVLNWFVDRVHGNGVDAE